MGLCGLGLLGDNLGKILGRAKAPALWRPGQPRKPDLAPRLPVRRPGSFERTAIPLPRSVGASVGGKGHRKLPPWWVGTDPAGRCGALSPRRPSPGISPSPGSRASLVCRGGLQQHPFLLSLTGPQALNGRLPQGLGKSEGGARVARLAPLLGLRSSSEGASSLGGRVQRGPGAQDQGGQSRKTRVPGR